MNKQVEKDFVKMVASLLQTEFCPDWNPELLHGCMGIASEGGELLEKYSASIETGWVPFERTDILIELSDLLHYMQMIMGELNSSISEVEADYSYCCNIMMGKPFFDAVVLERICERLDPTLLRGFIGITSRAGELLNRYKKFLYYHGEPFTRDEMLAELAKVLMFIQMILTKLDSSIEELMVINMAKLGSRYPYGYSHDKAITHQRDKRAERKAVESVIAAFVIKRVRDRKEEGKNEGEDL